MIHLTIFILTALFSIWCIYWCHQPKAIGRVEMASAKDFHAGDVVRMGIPGKYYLIRKVYTSSTLELERVEGMLAFTMAVRGWFREQKRQFLDLLKW